jgi:hypothetical protein
MILRNVDKFYQIPGVTAHRTYYSDRFHKRRKFLYSRVNISFSRKELDPNLNWANDIKKGHNV